MTALRALRLAFADVYDELLVLMGVGILGGALSLLPIPLPLMLGGHYGALRRAAEGRSVSLGDWLSAARSTPGSSTYGRWRPSAWPPCSASTCPFIRAWARRGGK